MNQGEDQFPNPGTDRRHDELERSLQAEADTVVSLARAVETDRVADEDREESQHRAGELEDLVVRQRKMIDVLALAVFVLLLAMIAIGVVLSV